MDCGSSLPLRMTLIAPGPLRDEYAAVGQEHHAEGTREAVRDGHHPDSVLGGVEDRRLLGERHVHARAGRVEELGCRRFGPRRNLWRLNRLPRRRRAVLLRDGFKFRGEQDADDHERNEPETLSVVVTWRGVYHPGDG